MGLISSGENEQLEFKETACRDLYKEKISQKAKEQIVKTVVSFMASTTGGKILIGVNDNGEITGIEADIKIANKIKQNIDAYELFLRNLLNDGIDTEIPFRDFSVDFHDIDGKLICEITVSPSDKPIYFNKKLYVRDGNQVLQLNGPDLIAYVKYRWG